MSSSPDRQTTLIFNGVNGDRGGYALQPMAPE